MENRDIARIREWVRELELGLMARDWNKIELLYEQMQQHWQQRENYRLRLSDGGTP